MLGLRVFFYSVARSLGECPESQIDFTRRQDASV